MTTLLERFAEKNVTFTMANGELRIMAEPGTLTPDLLTEIRQSKMELVGNLTSIRQRDHGDTGRTWAPGNPFTCECGFPTGWLRDGKPLCPVCDGKAPAGAGAITTVAIAGTGHFILARRNRQEPHHATTSLW